MNFEYLRNKNRILILIVYFEKYFQTLNLVIWVPKTPQLNMNDVNFIRRFHTMLDYMIPSRIVENLYTQLIHQIDFAITDASDSDSE